MGWWVGWAGELTCDALTTAEHSAIACAALRSTICHSCNPLAGLRQRRQLVVPVILQRLRVSRRRLDSYVARDRGYIRIAFMSDAVDGRSAARGRNMKNHVIVIIPQKSDPRAPSAAANEG